MHTAISRDVLVNRKRCGELQAGSECRFVIMYLTLVLGFLSTFGLTWPTFAEGGPELPLPCRAWRLPCHEQPWVCTTEEDYQRSLTGPQLGCPVFYNPNDTNTPPGNCVMTEGVCNFTERDVGCQSWLPVCGYAYRCGSDREYAQYLEESASVNGTQCAFTGYVPPPNGMCTFINGTCQWYNPCRRWEDTRCSSNSSAPMCGSHSEYWQYEFGVATPCSSPAPEDPPPGPCLLQDECGWLPAANATCPEGMEWNDRGQACRLTCDNYNVNMYCTPEWVPGCFCPEGMVEYRRTCILPSECPVNPCAYTNCGPYYYCRVSEVTGNAVCEPSCEWNNGGCPEGQICSIKEYKHYRYIQCTNPLAVECTGARSEFSACAGGHHCLELNGQSYCLPSCFVDNGGCREDQYCVTQPMEYSECSFGLEVCSTVRCIDKDDASGRCTPGKNHDDCDNSCGDACELYVQQDLEIVCPHVCFSGCYCPPGLVTFRERCVDPLECWSLLEDPPEVNLLPLPSYTAVIEFTILGVTRSEFVNQTDLFSGSVRDVLKNGGYSHLGFSTYAVLQEDNYIVVYLMFDHAGEKKLDGGKLASLFASEMDKLSGDVVGVSAVDGPVLQEEDDDGLSVLTVVGIVAAAVVFIVAVSAIAVVLLLVVKRVVLKPAVSVGASKPKEEIPATYSMLQEIASLENDHVEKPQQC